MRIWDITPLLPPTEPFTPLLPATPKNSIFNILYQMAILKTVNAKIPVNSMDSPSDLDYEKYLQFPNAELSALAASIVDSSDPDNVKMWKIEGWVQNNITYQSDVKTYGTSELWAYPAVTVQKGVGDCEDGAFLLHSLALHAGVDPARIRTYGGLVWGDEYGASAAGHAWVSYRREGDDKWIILDWCYWATDTALEDRIPMKYNKRYLDDFFFIEVAGTTETPYTNRVRYARGSLLNVAV